MPVWAWILLIAGLSALAVASLVTIVNHTIEGCPRARRRRATLRTSRLHFRSVSRESRT